jgi:hypothetical protein
MAGAYESDNGDSESFRVGRCRCIAGRRCLYQAMCANPQVTKTVTVTVTPVTKSALRLLRLKAGNLLLTTGIYKLTIRA